MNLTQIFRTLNDFLNEYDLPDTYATAYPNEDFPTASIIYLDTHPDFPDHLAWYPTGNAHVADVIYNGLRITVQTSVES